MCTLKSESTYKISMYNFPSISYSWKPGLAKNIQLEYEIIILNSHNFEVIIQ